MYKRVLLALLMGASIISCNRSFVKLDNTNAKGEVPQLANLVFRFSSGLAPDSLLNAWDSTEYISFEPKIPGRFRWNSPDELVFSPAQPLLPATSYKAKVRDEVLRFSKFNAVKDADDIRFNTAPLQLEDAFVTWVLQDESSRAGVPQLNMNFNYAVIAEELKEKLAIEVDGNKVDFQVENLGSVKNVTVKLPSFRAEDKSYEAKLQLDKGLKPEKGTNRTEEEITTRFTISSPFVLNINNVDAEHDGAAGLVHINTSQQVSPENIASFIRFEPRVAFTTEFRENGITLRSEQFSAEKSYELVISKGLKGRIGGVLKEEYNQGIAFGQLESDIRFANSKGLYLSRRGAGNIEVKITNTPKVRLIISRIYENNLMMVERDGYYPAGSYEDEETRFASYSDQEYINPVAGDVIYNREIDTRTLPRSGSGRLLNITQFEDRLPDFKGIYHVMIRSAEDYWVSDSRFISFSDLGLMARQSKDKMVVFANSIKTAQPLSGVTVNVYGANNQLMGTGATNGDGAAEISLVNRNYQGFKPYMVVAKTADDFNYLPFNTTKVNTSRFDVGGKRANATGLDAFIYAERDIYRPGEKINYAVVIRDQKWKSPGEIPLKLKFLLPNGKELKSIRKSINEQGALDGTLEVSAAAITGAYQLEVYTSNDVMLATKSFMVEEFVPDRIRLTAKAEKTAISLGQSVKVNVNAMNFFGPPAANRKYEAEIQVRKKRIQPKAFPGFDFTLANQKEFFDKDVQEGVTDENGNAALSFEADAMYANSGLLQATFFTTVFDETGRPVSRNVSVDLVTQEAFHGIKSDDNYYFPLNTPVHFEMVSVNRELNPVAAPARVVMIKHEYKTVLARNGSYFRYESQPQTKILAEQQVNIGPGYRYSFTPRSPGDYEVRVYRPGAATYVSRKFYSYGAWGGDNSSFEVNTEGHVDIALDRTSYAAGDVAKVLFKTPFSGRMLVTVEADQVVKYQYIDVEKRSASMDLKLNAEHLPNVYITATLIKPHEVADIPLTVAHGFMNVPVEEKGRKMQVEIAAQKSSRSRTRQKVRVKAAPGSMVSLAAVDNGILQVTDFKTPDPYNFYYQKKALQVNAYDMYPLLFPEVRGRMSSTGGDGESDMNKRVNPMPARRFKLMSYWSGIKKADGSGIAEFEYEIPQFSGEVRLMAVAFKDEKFGSAETTTTVADPVVISSSLPRFFSPGDTVLVRVTITNTTSKNASGKISVAATGPVKLAGQQGQAVNIAANGETRINFQVVAAPQTGVGKINFSVDALGENFREETEISVRPPSTLQKLAGSGSVAGGSSRQIAVPSGDFIPGSFRYELVVTKSPVGELGQHLKYLLQYPYGCTEQTISSVFPQLYFSDFAALFGGSDNRKQQANANVIEAIRKIRMRQLYNGAVTLWDGEGREDWWTTVYAAHFLLEAKKAGFDVEPGLLETMLGYLTNRLKTRESINYYYNRNQVKKIAPKEVAYSLYVLSLAGRSQVAAMNYYKANQATLALDGKYLLSAAYALAGDKRSFVNMLPSSFSGEESLPQTGGSYYSPLRDEAIALNALIEVDPGNAQIPVLANMVSERLKKERYLNTQERSFSFLALGKLARQSAGSNVKGLVKAGGKQIRIDGNWKGGHETLGNGPVEIIAEGQGRLYYSWIAEGISNSGDYTEEDQYIKVRRQFFDRYGRMIQGSQFRQNDLVIVEITLEKNYASAIENIVITDLLPAGFEIENPRTKEIPGMEWIKSASNPVALDVRDDRIHFFVDAVAPKQKYYYAVRVVSPGIFKQGPVSADAMYNGAIHSYHGAQVIRVVQ